MNALLYFLLWAGLIFLMMRFGCGAHVMGHGHGNAKRGHGDREAEAAAKGLLWIPPAKDIDPVCGKTVSTDEAKPSVHSGSVYYFCSRECREIFEAAPDQYVGLHANAPHSLSENSHV